jgi:hypothetical protein
VEPSSLVAVGVGGAGSDPIFGEDATAGVQLRSTRPAVEGGEDADLVAFGAEQLRSRAQSSRVSCRLSIWRLVRGCLRCPAMQTAKKLCEVLYHIRV